MDRTLTHPVRWQLLLVAIFLATGFSAWAALATSGCSSCGGAAVLLGGKSLAAAGVLYYGVLFAAAMLLGPSLFIFSGVLLAAGVHVGLLAILAQAKLFCLPCLATALAALAALVLAIRCESRNAFRASLVIPAAALIVQGWALFAVGIPVPTEVQAASLRESEAELGSKAVARGQVRMVLYTRPNCGYCIELEREVLPSLKRDFGDRLLIERRSAEQLPGIPTPTLILTGFTKRHLFPGLPDTEVLRSTLQDLMGESHGHETVLETSR